MACFISVCTVCVQCVDSVWTVCVLCVYSVCTVCVLCGHSVCTVRGSSVSMCVRTADALKTLDPVMFGKWSHYLGLKSAVYEAYVSFLSRDWFMEASLLSVGMCTGLLLLWQGAVRTREVWRVHQSPQTCSNL